MERIWIFMKITEDIIYAGVNDHQVDLFEGQYRVPNGMAYNSYVILDEKTAVMDTVDANFADEWLANVAKALDGRKPDYLIVQHMEPDHSANIENFVKVDVHQQSRWCAVLPGVISKCLSQRVTADMFILNSLLGSSPYNSVCLNSV